MISLSVDCGPALWEERMKTVIRIYSRALQTNKSHVIEAIALTCLEIIKGQIITTKPTTVKHRVRREETNNQPTYACVRIRHKAGQYWKTSPQYYCIVKDKCCIIALQNSGKRSTTANFWSIFRDTVKLQIVWYPWIYCHICNYISNIYGFQHSVWVLILNIAFVVLWDIAVCGIIHSNCPALIMPP